MGAEHVSKCSKRRSNGTPCKAFAVTGTIPPMCRTHGGSIPKVRAAAGVRAEVMKWGLGDAHADPAEVLLRLVSQSAARVEFYGRLLNEAYDAAERLKKAHEAGDLLIDKTVDEDGAPALLIQARDDLDRIFHTGGVAALIGRTYSDNRDGSIYATGAHAP